MINTNDLESNNILESKGIEQDKITLSKNRKKRSLTTLLIVVLATFSIFVVFSFVSTKTCNTNKVEERQREKALVFSTNDPKIIITELMEYFNNLSNVRYKILASNETEYVTKDSYFAWIDEDGYRIRGNWFYSSIEIPVSINSETENLSRPSSYPQTKEIAQLVSDTLTSNHFLNNIENSSTNDNDEKFWFEPRNNYQIAFAKSDTKCLLIIYNDWGLNKASNKPVIEGKIGCSNDITSATAEQVPYLDALAKYHNLDIIEYTSERFELVDKVIKINNYFELQVYGGVSWYIAIGKIENNTPIILFTTNGTPQCSDLDEHNIPVELVSVCVKNNEYITRN